MMRLLVSVRDVDEALARRARRRRLHRPQGAARRRARRPAVAHASRASCGRCAARQLGLPISATIGDVAMRRAGRDRCARVARGGGLRRRLREGRHRARRGRRGRVLRRARRQRRGRSCRCFSPTSGLDAALRAHRLRAAVSGADGSTPPTSAPAACSTQSREDALRRFVARVRAPAPGRPGRCPARRARPCCARSRPTSRAFAARSAPATAVGALDPAAPARAGRADADHASAEPARSAQGRRSGRDPSSSARMRATSLQVHDRRSGTPRRRDALRSLRRARPLRRIAPAIARVDLAGLDQHEPLRVQAMGEIECDAVGARTPVRAPGHRLRCSSNGSQIAAGPLCSTRRCPPWCAELQCGFIACIR